jgi:predicted nucleic acid-binding protein
MMQQSKIFVDQTAWYELLDEHSPYHDLFAREFEIALNSDSKLFTSNVAVGNSISQLKETLGNEIAIRFHEILEEAHIGAHLRILWVSRRSQKEAMRLLRKNSGLTLHFYDFAHAVLMERRRIKNILTTKKEFYELGYKVLADVKEQR